MFNSEQTSDGHEITKVAALKRLRRAAICKITRAEGKI